MYQFYIIEIQQYADGTFGHIVHWASDEDADMARNKADSKYYEVLSACAISNLPQHSAIMFSADGFPIEHKCYQHDVESEVVEE